MNLYLLLRQLWNELRWQLPPWMIDSLDTLKEYMLLILRPHLNIIRLTGEGAGGALTVTYAIHGYDTELKRYLKSLLFVTEPVEQTVGRIPLWRAASLLDDSASDLVFIGASKYFIHRMLRQDVVMLPRLVFQSLVVRGTWEDVLGRLHDNLRKDYLKAMRRFGYDYKTSHEDEDFEMFFDQMYVPLMQAHHNSLAMIASRREAYRVFQRGVLFLVYRDGQCVSGELSQIDDRHKLIHARFIGVRDGDEQLVREGAQKAARHAVIHWANRHGYHEVNFQGCEPFLSKGILQDKKRWGAGIQSSNHKRILLKIQRSTPAVCRFLENNPCIIISKQEDLRGLFFVEDSPSIPALTREKCEKTCAMPGLDGYFVRTVNDFLLPQPNDKDSEKSVSLSRNPM